MIWTPEMIEELRSLAEEGWSSKKIAVKFDVTRNAVIGKCHREDIKLLGSKNDSTDEPKFKPKHTRPLKTPQAAKVPKPQSVRDSREILLFELNKTTCRWPTNDGGPFLFCGQPIHKEFPYCKSHCLRAYNPDHRWRTTHEDDSRARPGVSALGPND